MTVQDILKLSSDTDMLGRALGEVYDLSVKYERAEKSSAQLTKLTISDNNNAAPNIVIGLLDHRGIADITIGPFYFTDAEGHTQEDLASVLLSILEGGYSYKSQNILPFTPRKIALVVDAPFGLSSDLTNDRAEARKWYDTPPRAYAKK